MDDSQRTPPEPIEGSFQQAMRHQGDSPDDGAIMRGINLATGSLHFDRSEAALEEGDLEASQTELDSAREALGDTAAIRTVQTRIDNLSAYRELLAEGDTQFANNEFGRAKATFMDAREIFNNEQINTRIEDCNFSIWLQQCDREIQVRRWDAASAALERVS